MPRPNKARSIEAERNLARRIKMERQSRGWSPARLAQRMTEAGCSIATSAIYKIEDQENPRKIAVDEMVALGEVFGIEDLRDLLKPAGFVKSVTVNIAPVIQAPPATDVLLARIAQLAAEATTVNDAQAVKSLAEAYGILYDRCCP